MAEEALEVGRRLRRREFLIAGAGAGLALASPINFAGLARARALPPATGAKFAYGVASGIPSQGAITLWTRLKGLDRTSSLRVEVATDSGFRHVVKRHDVLAEAGRDFTVHTRVGGLTPASQYHYRFETEDTESRVGTFRTLPPPDSNQQLRIGFYSCQSYEAGYYTAHSALAKEKDLDLVLCLGDYIYEHHYYDGPTGRVDKTGANDDGDVQTLAEYRQKYRFYQSDKNLQDMHAAIRLSSSGTTTRSRTTTPASTPTRPRPIPPTSRTTTATPGGYRSASGERTATRPSSRRCRGSSSPRTQTASTGHSASGRWPSSS